MKIVLFWIKPQSVFISWGSDWQYVRIDSGNDLAPSRRLVVIITNHVEVLRNYMRSICHYDLLSANIIMMIFWWFTVVAISKQSVVIVLSDDSHTCERISEYLWTYRYHIALYKKTDICSPGLNFDACANMWVFIVIWWLPEAVK